MKKLTPQEITNRATWRRALMTVRYIALVFAVIWPAGHIVLMLVSIVALVATDRLKPAKCDHCR